MELSKPGSHAWEAERGDKRTIISLIPTHSHTLVGFPPHGGEARDHFISQLVGACILHREERLLALYGLALALRLYCYFNFRRMVSAPRTARMASA